MTVDPRSGLRPERLRRAGAGVPAGGHLATVCLAAALAWSPASPAASSGDDPVQWFASRAALLAHAGATPLAEETWARGFAPAGSLAECFQAVGERVDDPCLSPGAAVAGFAVRTRLGSVFFEGTDVDLVMLGEGFAGVPARAVGNNVIGGGELTPTVVDFAPAVTLVGLTLHEPMTGGDVRIRVFGTGGVELADQVVVLPGGTGFGGFASTAPVVRVEINAVAADGGELFSGLLFGGGEGRLQSAADVADFGIGLRGQRLETTLSLVNAGWLELAVPGLPGLATLPAPFAVADDACTGAVLDPGDTCEVTLAFTPAHDGEFGHLLELGPVGAGGVALSGQARGPRLAAQPGHLSFGEVAVGTSSSPQALTLTNLTGAPVRQVPLALPAQLARTGGDCGASTIDLAPGESCTLVLTFSPGVPGEYDVDLPFEHAGGLAALATVSGRASAGGAP